MSVSVPVTNNKVFDTTTDGLVPKSGSNTDKFLKGDGSWAKPQDTTYSTFDTTTDGLVPKSGSNTDKFLKGDGSWAKPQDTTYSTFDTTTDGLVPKSGSNTSKYLRGDKTWATPANDKVTQTNTTSDTDKRLLLSSAANDTASTSSTYKSSNFTANPSTGILHATILDSDNISDMNNVLGAKNFIKYPYSETTTTKNGVTFTVNSDGSVTATGKATSEAIFTLHSYVYHSLTLDNGTYILSGCPSGGTVSTYHIHVQVSSSGISNYYDYGSGKNVYVEGSNISVGVNIVIKTGYTCPSGGLTFKPMIRLASDPDDTYAPYAMTNRALTEKVNKKVILDSGNVYHTCQQVNVWFYSNASVTIPANSFFAFYGTDVYASGQPYAVRFSSSLNNQDWEVIAETIGGTVSFCGYTDTTVTYHLFCKELGLMSQNYSYIRGWYEPIN